MGLPSFSHKLFSEAITRLMSFPDDSDAFSAAYRILFPRLSAYLFQKGHGQDAAEEIVQDYMSQGFFSSIERLKKEHGKSPSSPEIYIAFFKQGVRFASLNWLKKEKKNTPSVDSPEFVFPESVVYPDTEGIATVQTLRSVVLMSVASLENREDQKILLIRLCAPFSVRSREVAAFLDLRYDLFRKRFSRAAKKFCINLEKNLEHFGLQFSDIELLGTLSWDGTPCSLFTDDERTAISAVISQRWSQKELDQHIKDIEPQMARLIEDLNTKTPFKSRRDNHEL